MTVVIASDLHGSSLWTKRLLRACEAEKASQLLLLGDLLYHGPRNPLPEEYDPKAVVEMLNAWRSKIIAIRGNCDAEVDSMLLQFPLVESALLFLDGHRFYCTHGHHYNPENLPPLAAGDLLLYGHTHLYQMEKQAEIWCLNPGSVALPKNGQAETYMIYRNHECTIKSMDGVEILRQKL